VSIDWNMEIFIKNEKPQTHFRTSSSLGLDTDIIKKQAKIVLLERTHDYNATIKQVNRKNDFIHSFNDKSAIKIREQDNLASSLRPRNEPRAPTVS
jgi:hypothetical protein